MYAPVNGVQASASTRDTLNASASGAPLEMTPLDGSVRMSDRFSFSSTKYGPSVRAAVRTHVGEAVVPAAVPVLSAAAAVAAEQARSGCDTTTIAAALAARSSSSRRV